jgi:muramidase (phage lysozyme)
MTPQLQAFLDTIATSEGTAHIGDRGYNCLVGSTPQKPVLFQSYADHPRVRVELRANLFSTAAGRYQILARYYDIYKARLSLPDFSPASQDAIAIEMIREQGALADVEAGRFDEAVAKCANIWASLPGAGYGQHENRIADLRRAFASSGGVVA